MKKISNQAIHYHIPANALEARNLPFGKPWLILTDAAEWEQPELQNFLYKILQAIHIDADTDAHIQSCAPGMSYPLSQLDRDHPLRILAFGVDPELLLLQDCNQHHQLYHLGKWKLLLAFKLSQYNQESSKRLLWNALKALEQAS